MCIYFRYMQFKDWLLFKNMAFRRFKYYFNLWVEEYESFTLIIGGTDDG